MGDSEVDLEKRLRRTGRRGAMFYRLAIGVCTLLVVVAVVALNYDRIEEALYGTEVPDEPVGRTVVVSWFILDPEVDGRSVPQLELAGHLDELAEREPGASIVIHTDDETKAAQVAEWARQAGLVVDATRVESRLGR